MAGRAEGLQTQGEGKKEILLRDQFPPDQQARYDIFAVKCIKCHEMARPIAALKTGQVVALTTGNVAALTTAQVQAVTTAGVAALTTAQAQALTTAQIVALTLARFKP